jgi:anti-sigma-K factor RskA
MNIAKNPKLLTHLAQSRALGLLSPRTLARLEAIAQNQPTVRAQLLLWQHHFASITELQGNQNPSPNVWKRIELSIQPQLAPAIVAKQKYQWFTWLAAGAALASVFLSVSLVKQNQQLESAVAQAKTQAVQYVAVLKDNQAKESLLVTLDTSSVQWRVKRLDSYREAADRSLQLWALPENGKPKSIGVLDTSDQVKLQAAIQLLRSIPNLAVSLEPKGGVPEAGGPTGPVLFQGRFIETPV